MRRQLLSNIGRSGWTTGLVCAVLIASIAVPALADSRKSVGSLRVGDALFWDGEYVDETSDPLRDVSEILDEDPCPDDSCFEYEIDVKERGARLRIAIDTPDCEDEYTLELVNPGGTTVAEDVSCYSAEVYADRASTGTWIAKVVPVDATNSLFRMRAKLEGERPENGPRRLLLPNLRVEPPHQFTFHTGGLASQSCYEDETIEDKARRCLRFSVGPQNVGEGPLELKFARLSDAGTEASMFQRLYYSDGTSEMRDAGMSEFHKTHRHFHLKGFAKFDLLRVTDRSEGEMVAAGTGHKSGFCLVDLRIAQWRRFNQQSAYSARSNCFPVGGEAELGLSTGWTDVYGYELPGNYIEFAGKPNGYYVVRTTVDSEANIRESNDRDNVGYAYIRVVGDEVTVLERGRGRSPWDPNKVVLREWWKAATP